MDDQTELAQRVNALKAPDLLTQGIHLSKEESQRCVETVRMIKERGFAILPRFLERDVVARVCREMKPIFDLTTSREITSGSGVRRKGYSGVQTVHVHNLFSKTRAVDEFAINPLLLKIIEGVLGLNFQISVATAMCPDPGTDPQGFHQDDGHYPLPRPRPTFIANTLIALDDFTKENGATRLVPFSHNWTAPVRQDVEFEYAEMEAGSLLVFDGALWHSGGGNRTSEMRRRSININFNLSWLRQQENQYLGLSRETWLSLPEKLQRLLGLQRVNYLYGGVDYTDPLLYLKNSE